MARSANAGTERLTGSLNMTPPAGIRKVALPLTVSLRMDAGTIADSLSRTAIDAPAMLSAAVPNVFEKTTRARVPATDVRTICRSVWWFGVMGGGPGGACTMDGAPAVATGGGPGGAGGGSMGALATTAVVHVATQCSAPFACARIEDALRASTVSVNTSVRTMAMLSPSERLMGAIERLGDVSKNILGRLASDTETDEAFTDVIARPARPAFRHRMHASEARRLTNERQGTQERLVPRPRSDVEAHDRAESSHLAPGDLVTGMGGQSGIVHGGDIRTRRKERRHTHDLIQLA